MLAADCLRLSCQVGGVGGGGHWTGTQHHTPLYLSPILTFGISL
jgi:hypothetical protein